MPWMQELGKEIKAERERSGMSQATLAGKLSVGRTQLGNYENGNSAIPVNILAEIARALRVESFTVDGYKVVLDGHQPKPTPAPAQQLAFAFDLEHRFGSGSVKITSADPKGGIVITAVFKEPRSA
jgi:transcriptional regulator with XRE-family HTH domain